MNFRPKSLTVCALVLLALGFAASAEDASTVLTRDPIAAFGHGTFFGPDGKAFTPDRASSWPRRSTTSTS